MVALFATESARLQQICIQTCHLIFLCCCCSLISGLILQTSWMWKHLCDIALPAIFYAVPSEPSTWTRLWWHTIILPVNPIMMPDLLECQWAPSPWNHRQLKQHNGLVELCGMQRVCVCVFMPECIEPLAIECLRMCLYSCVGVHLSAVATVFALAQFITNSNIFCDDLFMLFTDVTRNVGRLPRVNCGRHQICAIGNVVGVNLYDIHSIWLCLSTCVFCMRHTPLYDLCLQSARIPAGRVLHTDHREEGDVEHADVRSPPHTEHGGHVELHTEF